MRTTRRYWHKTDVAVLLFCVALALSSFAAAGRQGRMRAKGMVCRSNLHQWNKVFQDYMADNGGSFFTGTPPSGYWWPAQLDEAAQSWKQNRTWFCPTASSPFVDEFGISTPGSMTFKAWGIYHASGLLGEDGIAGSYGLNGYTIAISGFGRSGPTFETGVPAGEGWRDFASVTNADRVPLFLGAMRFDLWPLHTDSPAAHESAAWAGSHMARCSIDRHNGAVNSLFLDGSARKVGLKELWTLKWYRSFNITGPWTMAGGAIPADWPEWMRGFKDY